MAEIAIVISTRNRPKEFQKTFNGIESYFPNDAVLLVVDDCSDENYANAHYRFEKRVGIPRVKNKCLELAMNTGANHIFLFDDDIFPIIDGWEKPYIESGINHLSYNFNEPYLGVNQRQSKIIDGFKVSSIPNGCMLYFTRHCIEQIGGFDEGFGMGCYEHTDLTRRIYNAGLTPFKNMDVIGSDKLFHSMDRHQEVQRNFSTEERSNQLMRGSQLFNEKANDKSFISYGKESTSNAMGVISSNGSNKPI